MTIWNVGIRELPDSLTQLDKGSGRILGSNINWAVMKRVSPFVSVLGFSFLLCRFQRFSGSHPVRHRADPVATPPSRH